MHAGGQFRQTDLATPLEPVLLSAFLLVHSAMHWFVPAMDPRLPFRGEASNAICPREYCTGSLRWSRVCCVCHFVWCRVYRLFSMSPTRLRLGYEAASMEVCADGQSEVGACVSDWTCMTSQPYTCWRAPFREIEGPYAGRSCVFGMALYVWCWNITGVWLRIQENCCNHDSPQDIV